LTQQCGALLIFDEVMTGFRVAAECAQGRYGVRPDLTCLGKIVGGGFPLAAFGGRRELMQALSPVGPVYQAGTLSGNPVAVAAGLATLQLLDASVYRYLEQLGERLEAALSAPLAYHGWSMARVGSMFTLFARPEPPKNFVEAKECDLEAFAALHRAALRGGIYLPPSQFEAAFLCTAHSESDIHRIAEGLAAAVVLASG
jgi:glutamate-1-semialdehyde 2,1-aminomutase